MRTETKKQGGGKGEFFSVLLFVSLSKRKKKHSNLTDSGSYERVHGRQETCEVADDVWNELEEPGGREEAAAAVTVAEASTGTAP